MAQNDLSVPPAAHSKVYRYLPTFVYFSASVGNDHSADCAVVNLP